MDINWYHLFDSQNLWLTDEGTWSTHYADAREFISFEAAQAEGRLQIRSKGPDYDGTIVVLADCGQVQ